MMRNKKTQKINLEFTTAIVVAKKGVSTFEGSSPFPITGFVVLEKPHESSGSTSSVVDLVAKGQPRWTPNLTSNSPPILSFHHRFHWVDVEQMEGVGKVISRLFSWDSIALQSVRLSHFLTFGPTHYCSTCLKDKDKDTILQNLDLKKEWLSAFPPGQSLKGPDS